jgi:predicted DsbA family dithiol-disulfide isomerase
MHIDIVHDTACPWCRIGKHNLHTALADWQGEPVTIRYWTYFLNPNLPPEGGDFHEVMRSKYRNVDMQQMFDGPTRAGAAVGLKFDFSKVTRAPNTLLSHRLIALVPDEKREAVIDAIYAAYFEHGQNISLLDVLLDIAEAQGLDRAEYKALLESDAAQKEVVEQAAQMMESGVSGVPFFIFNGKWAISGAHPPATFRQVLAKVAQESAGDQPAAAR